LIGLWGQRQELEPDKINIKTAAKAETLIENIICHDEGNATLRPTHCLKVVVLAEGE
jgi:hypothetical protein